jgi:TRAP-type C4-dicarboxylate transport system permease small subunit
MAWFNASGVVFAVLAGLIIVLELWKLATGQIPDDQLVGIVESEEVREGRSENPAQPSPAEARP